MTLSSGCGWGSWRLMEESGFQVKHGRGGAISFLAPGQDKYTRLRASTLGPGFDPDDYRAAIAGERPIPELPQDSPAPARCVNLIIDIQERMAQGKGPAYERWAKVYNIKQMAAALLYLREHGLSDYEALATSTEGRRWIWLTSWPGSCGTRRPPFPKPPSSWARWCSMQRRGLCLTATRRPGIAENICPSMRQSWQTTGRQRRL